MRIEALPFRDNGIPSLAVYSPDHDSWINDSVDLSFGLDFEDFGRRLISGSAWSAVEIAHGFRPIDAQRYAYCITTVAYDATNDEYTCLRGPVGGYDSKESRTAVSLYVLFRVLGIPLPRLITLCKNQNVQFYRECFDKDGESFMEMWKRRKTYSENSVCIDLLPARVPSLNLIEQGKCIGVLAGQDYPIRGLDAITPNMPLDQVVKRCYVPSHVLHLKSYQHT